MKKLKYLCSAFLVASLLAIPAAAQKTHGIGGGAIAGNNRGHSATGPARADEVHDAKKPKKTKKTKKKENEGNHKAEGKENPM